MSWSDEDFRARVDRRCAELGRSKRAVLRAAGLSHDYLQSEPTHGRRIDILEKVAAALDWSLGDLMGIELSHHVDAVLMAKTLYVARKVMRHFANPDVGVEAQILTSIYNTLLDRQQDGEATDSANLDEIAKMMVNWVSAQARTPQIQEFLTTGPSQSSKKSI